MPVTIKGLKKENNGLRNQIDALMKQLKNLQAKVDDKMLEKSSTSTPPCSPAEPTEASKSLDFLGLECDDLSNFRASALEEISTIKSRLDAIADKVDELSDAIEEFQAYSYGFNVKILGIPELVASETALQTTTLCVKIFNKMGAETTIHDIDIAHRVKPRNASSRPKPIICKFTRRLAREEVMNRRADVSHVASLEVGLPESASLRDAMIVDHLTPNTQELFSAAKTFKDQHEFKFCWTKKGLVYLRRTEDSRPIKIKNSCDLQRLAQGDLE